MTTSLSISDREFSQIRNLVYDRFGINLTEQKRALVVGRLQKLLRDEGFSNFRDYLAAISIDSSGESLDKLVNRITTNHTYFNREHAHFDFYAQKALPYWQERLEQSRSRDLRVWSAGCSSGEEAYMLAILTMEHLGSAYDQWAAGILATDISEKVLSIARNGIYDNERISRIPPGFKNRYFVRKADGNWQVNERLKKQVTFRRFNLMNKQFPFKSKFHIIFCRNVMIYFDAPTREALVARFRQHLEPGGFFFIGHSETLGRERSDFEYVMPALYRRL